MNQLTAPRSPPGTPILFLFALDHVAFMMLINWNEKPRALSPQHCIFINESLIPVVYLINENSIAEDAPSDMSALEYYHIEFDTHEVIYAEGALVESYDGWDRENFSNFVQYERLYGRERRSSMKPFAPILRYDGRVQELKGLVRSLVSDVVVDIRDPIQVAYDQLAKRAEAMLV